MENKTCCIFNFAPHYRSSIYKLMDKEVGCDFYFGDKVATSIKKLDYVELHGFQKEVKNHFFLNNKFIWQKGVVSLIFKPKYKYFVLTGDSSILSNWVIAFFALLLNKKVFLWMHGLKGELSWKGKILTYPLYHMASKFLLYSDYSREFMVKKGFNSNKMICIYNSLDYNLQLDVRKGLVKTNIYVQYFKNNLPVLIYIGRIQKLKKIGLIIEAMAILRDKNIFCNLVIIGSDTENTGTEELIIKNKFENNVWMYGACYEENKLGELIYNADVCVSPGNIGLTAMHSFSYGTPAITHNNFSNQMPEFEAISPGFTGDFFLEDNVDDLSNKIQKWINLNEFQRDNVRAATFKIIDERYNPHYQVEVLQKLLTPDL